VHDKWEDLETIIPKIIATDSWTLRRVPLE
jgi:hypothetical protein